MKTYFALILFFFTQFCFGQTQDTLINAQYQGNEESFLEYMNKNSVYPEEAIKKGIDGTVYASFIIDSAGIIDTIWIVESAGSYLDQAVISAVQGAQNWEPTTKNGMSIETQVNVKVGFYQSMDRPSPKIPEGFGRPIKVNIHNIIVDDIDIIHFHIMLQGGRGGNYQQGCDAMKNKEYEKAIEYFNKAYRGNPQDSEISYKRGLAKIKTNNVKGACKDLKRAEKLGSKMATNVLAKYCN